MLLLAAVDHSHLVDGTLLIAVRDSTELRIWQMWIPCPRTNTPRENVETPSAFQTSFLEGSLGEHGRFVMYRTRHGAFPSTFR